MEDSFVFSDERTDPIEFSSLVISFCFLQGVASDRREQASCNNYGRGGDNALKNTGEFPFSDIFSSPYASLYFPLRAFELKERPQGASEDLK